MKVLYKINHPDLEHFFIGADGELYKEAYTDSLGRKRSPRMIRQNAKGGYHLVINTIVVWMPKITLEEIAVKLDKPFEINLGGLKLFK